MTPACEVATEMRAAVALHASVRAQLEAEGREAPPIADPQLLLDWAAVLDGSLVDSDRIIVAEVSKTWVEGRSICPDDPLLCQQFERVIRINAARGYRLQTFKLNQVLTSPLVFVETIIAVFERV